MSDISPSWVFTSGDRINCSCWNDPILIFVSGDVGERINICECDKFISLSMVFVCLSVYKPSRLFINLSIYLHSITLATNTLSLSLSLSIYLSISIYLYLSIYIYLSISIYIYLSIYPSISFTRSIYLSLAYQALSSSLWCNIKYDNA